MDGITPQGKRMAAKVYRHVEDMTIDEFGRLQIWKDNRQKLVVPLQLRREVFKSLHDNVTSGHFGINKTYARLQERFWWPEMYRDTVEWCKTCDACQ